MSRNTKVIVALRRIGRLAHAGVAQSPVRPRNLNAACSPVVSTMLTARASRKIQAKGAAAAHASRQAVAL
jgi:hypothetical protein